MIETFDEYFTISDIPTFSHQYYILYDLEEEVLGKQHQHNNVLFEASF